MRRVKWFAIWYSPEIVQSFPYFVKLQIFIFSLVWSGVSNAAVQTLNSSPKAHEQPPVQQLGLSSFPLQDGLCQTFYMLARGRTQGSSLRGQSRHLAGRVIHSPSEVAVLIVMSQGGPLVLGQADKAKE